MIHDKHQAAMKLERYKDLRLEDQLSSILQIEPIFIKLWREQYQREPRLYGELIKIYEWALAVPARKKIKNWDRFVANWLKRSSKRRPT